MSPIDHLCRRLAASLLATLAVAFLFATAPAAAAPCTQNCLTPGEHIGAMLYKGLLRSYIVHVPASYTGRSDVPLVIDFHGGSVNALNERQYSGQLQQSDQRGFIVVWPEGVATTWNAYGCCLASNMLALDDVGFARAVIAAVKSRAAIDNDRVFATGISNGGGMAQRMACEAADVIRAAVSVSFPMNTDTCRPSRPIGIAEIAGSNDTNIPYNGSNGPVVPVIGNLIGFGPVESARSSFVKWHAINRCSDDIAREQLPNGSQMEEYLACADGVRTALVTIQGGRHVLYNGYVDPLSGYDGNNAPIDVADYIWTHFFNI